MIDSTSVKRQKNDSYYFVQQRFSRTNYNENKIEEDIDMKIP